MTDAPVPPETPPRIGLPAWPHHLPRRVVHPEVRTPAATDRGDRPFFLGGDRASIRGTPSRGVEEIRIHPLRALRSFRTHLPPAHRVELAPGAARREISLETGSLVESLLVFHRLPAAVLQWEVTGASRADLELEWLLPDGASAREEGGTLSVHLPGAVTGFHVQSTEVEVGWKIDPVAGGAGTGTALHVRARVRLPEASPLTLLVAAAEASGVAGSVVRKRLAGLEREMDAWVSDSVRADRSELGIEIGEPPVEAGWSWARRRLGGSFVHPGGRRPGMLLLDHGGGCAPLGDAAWIGHGLLAAGRHRDAGELVALVAESLARVPRGVPLPAFPDPGTASPCPDTFPPTGEGASPAGPDGLEAALLLHLTARYGLWTADHQPIRRLASTLPDWFARLLSPRARGGGPERPGQAVEPASSAPPDPASPQAADPRTPLDVAARAALSACADAVEAAGDRGQATRLRALTAGGAAGSASPGIAGGTPPGAAGAAARSPEPSILAAVLDEAATPVEVEGSLLPGGGREGGGHAGAGEAGADDSAGDLAPALGIWAEWKTGSPDRAVEPWRSLLEGELRDRPDHPCALRVAESALGVALFLYGFLGGRADASFGRLRLAPRIPRPWRSFRVRNIRVGDSLVDLSYRREKGRHTFHLHPTAGRVPLRLVFEPLVPTDAIRAVSVGGAPAETDRYGRPGFTGVRLQLPLDGPREIVLEEDEHAG